MLHNHHAPATRPTAAGRGPHSSHAPPHLEQHAQGGGQHAALRVLVAAGLQQRGFGRAKTLRARWEEHVALHLQWVCAQISAGLHRTEQQSSGFQGLLSTPCPLQQSACQLRIGCSEFPAQSVLGREGWLPVGST